MTDLIKYIEVYTDGSCPANPGPCGAGVHAIIDDEVVEKSVYLGEGTNNVAELQAISIGIDVASAYPRALRIYTDSQYSIGVLTWGWVPKANQELISAIKQKIDAYAWPIKFVKVKGHSGIPGNERADVLAGEAVANRDTTPAPAVLKCPRCKSCARTPAHPCPYDTDVHGDFDSRCTCCDACENACAADI